MSDEQTRRSGSRWEPTAAPSPEGGTAGAAERAEGRIDDEFSSAHVRLASYPDPTPHPLPPTPVGAPVPRRTLRGAGLLAAAAAGLLAIGGAAGYAIGHSTTRAAPAGAGLANGMSGYGHQGGQFGHDGGSVDRGTGGGNVDQAPQAGTGSTGAST